MNKISLYSTFLISFLVLFSCKKTDNPLDTNVQPDGDIINGTFSDTASIYGYTVKYDSVRTYQDRFKFLGSNQDPVFGRTDAGIFTNFSLPNNVSNISFGDDAVLDSVKVYLVFTQNYVGDTTTLLNYKVFELNSAVDNTLAKYMHHSVPFSSTPICDVNVKPSVIGGFYTVVLPLNYYYGAAILNNTSALVSNAIFQSVYKGFYITTKSTNLNPINAQGALKKMDLDNPVSGLLVFYHNGSQAAAKTSKAYRFPFLSDSPARFNNIQYNYLSGGNPQLVNQLTSPIDTNLGPQNLFLKGVGSTKAVIRIPFLRNYSKDCHVAVNRAEVIFKVDQSFVTAGGTYDPPPTLALVAMDSLKKEIFTKDQFYSSDLLHFGGTYDADNKQYVFNIARHVQDIMEGRIKNYGFYLVVADPDRNYVSRRDDRAERVVLGGHKNALYAPKIKLTYIRFPNDK